MIYLVLAVLCLVLALALAFWISWTRSPGNMLYLVMAILWMGLALVAFLMPFLVPNAPPWSIPIGCFALLLVAYDITRWWLSRGQKPPDRRLLRPVSRHASSEELPDTRFQIRDE